MKFFVVKTEESNVAVVFHDYVSSRFIVRSISESFRRAFEAAVSVVSGFSFYKDNGKLKYVEFGPQHPSWVTKVLSKVCQGYWSVCAEGNIIGDAFIEDVVAEYLSVNSDI